ncbi:glycosyltransferase [Achromobacter xylosoxidans]|uniref:glycosyltransferase n=1 Tax=Alcaligenes xylosoxydans xylosoxydans TaxID=85698 RepID=UPI0006C865FE|nr:glycosyltransferase [Achromobacter xylosoxidans]AMH05448.1 glycoside hydrolase [Achromobacter xylosoxidans]MCH4573415.1 glycosyltransferase [Achromobacter xylosoxidans]MDD7987674.1 glycosyltransferase [Achromobacter xylosoxidans]NEV03442.1 glycosyltransferase [Achromobacter xylosoxidans]OFO58345.1 glycoside hydrolase [Achromobacter xylosoxidans]
MARINAHLYPSDLLNESRIFRITEAMVRNGIVDRVEIIGVQRDGLPMLDRVDSNRNLVRLRRSIAPRSQGLLGKTVRTIEWSVRALNYLRKQNFLYINAHSLPVLPLCFIASKLTGARLIYDTHELETETHSCRGIRQRLARLVERLLIKRCSGVFVVSDTIADWYVARYGIARPYVVRNIPTPAHSNTDQPVDLKERLNIPSHHRLYLYQGGFLPGRGIERLLRVFATLPTEYHLTLMGDGPLLNVVRAAAAQTANIHFFPAVPPSDVLRHTRTADVGICPTESTCLSYHYSLPNKLFEFLHAELPVIVTPLPEQVALVEQFQCGWIAPADDRAFAELLSGLTSEDIEQASRGAVAAATHYTWQHEEGTLVRAYGELRAAE